MLYLTTDDTQIYFLFDHSKSIEAMDANNANFETVVKTSKDLYLRPNVEKTLALIFGSEKERAALTNIQLFIDGRPIVFIERAKNIGGILGNHLTFTDHVN